MTTRGWLVVIVILGLVILALLGLLIVLPTPSVAPVSGATSTPATSINSTVPLSASVSVSSPQQNATVGQTFTVRGLAPNAWYFEAVFPMQVRDQSDNVIAHAQGQAQSDWTIPGPVAFNATVALDTAYHGPATLILLRDNPSGLPQNDDSVEVPIVIQ